MNPIKDIVFGANGFVGAYLVNFLKEQGREVIPLSWEILVNPLITQRYLKKYQPCRIYYLAAYGNLHNQIEIKEMYNAIIIKLLNLLEATENIDLRGFVTTGTTSEYGNKKEPMNEEMILKPNSFYGAAKAGATHLAQAWAFNKNKPIVIYRPASITGVNEHRIHLIPALIRSCLYQEPMHFIKEPTHDYISVKDVVRAISILGEQAQNYKGEIFNVGTGREWSNQQVREMIEDITGKKANITGSNNLWLYEKSEVWAVNSTKMNNLGWQPTITLWQILEEMVKHERVN
jgi:nucleoside-diphosphate-sugar epimerase